VKRKLDGRIDELLKKNRLVDQKIVWVKARLAKGGNWKNLEKKKGRRINRL